MAEKDGDRGREEGWRMEMIVHC